MDENQEDNSDFEGGFNEEPVDTAEKPKEQEPEQVAEEIKQEVAKYAQLTEEELITLRERAALAAELKVASEKQFGTAFGKMGGLERKLNELAEQFKGSGPVDITEIELEALSRDYPDLASAIAKDLSKVLSKARGNSPAQINPDQLEQLVQMRVAPALQEAETRIEQKMEMKALKKVVPDWESVVTGQTFKEWLGRQPQDYQKQVNDSWDADFVASAISNFKSNTAPQPKKEVSNARSKQLAAAVQPRGAAGHVPSSSVEDDFEDGFKNG